MDGLEIDPERPETEINTHPDYLRILKENNSPGAAFARLNGQPSANSDTAQPSKSIARNTRGFSSDIPRLRRAACIAMPLVAPNEPIVFGVPIVKKPPVLPSTSGVAHTIAGDPDKSDKSDSDSPAPAGPRKAPGNTNREHRKGRKPPSRDSPLSNLSDSSSSGSEPGDNICRFTPDSDHDSDSLLSSAHRKHCQLLDKLKHQQAFLKSDPLFTYEGDVRSSKFKKWVRESRAWIKSGRLSVCQGILSAGKYLIGNNYKYFEREVVKGKKHSSLNTFYEGLFDYIFPVRFRENQRNLYDTVQQNSMSGLTFIRVLEDFANTLSDVKEPEIIRVFTRPARASIQSQPAFMGYRAEDLNLANLEILVFWIEESIATRNSVRSNTSNVPATWLNPTWLNLPQL